MNIIKKKNEWEPGENVRKVGEWSQNGGPKGPYPKFLIYLNQKVKHETLRKIENRKNYYAMVKP